MLWYRSLYWRIAVGFVACLALLLVVQGILFVWMMGRAGSAIPNQPPGRFAQTVALDVSQAVTRDPALDIEHYVRQGYAADSQPFLVLLVDSRTVEIGARFPKELQTEARALLDSLRTMDPARLARGVPLGRGGPFPFQPPRPEPPQAGQRAGPEVDLPAGRSAGPGSPRGRGPAGGRGGPPGLRMGRPSPIFASGQLFGLVVVPPQPPFSFLLIRYAPTLATVAGATLIAGGVLAALVIFGPTRRRLRAVEEAARRLGSGDLSARAPAGGSDEVAAVASAFNAMADDLSARTDALMAADTARRQLLADVSHELNTPVTAMRGYLETLSMPELTLDDLTRARYLAIVGDETARLERIIGDLLDLARLEGGGGGALEVEPVRTKELFERVLARHERTAAAARVTLNTEIEPGADCIAGDRTRLEQALENLAANALRHAPEDSSVWLRAVNDAGSVTILVSDEGPGIPQEHVSKVFDRFYKVDPARLARPDTADGSGLGLSIVKAIVERHGAHISVASATGRTVFEIAGLRRLESCT